MLCRLHDMLHLTLALFSQGEPEAPGEKVRSFGKRLEETKLNVCVEALMNACSDSLRPRDVSIYLDPLCSLPATMFRALKDALCLGLPCPLTSCWAHPGRQGQEISGQDEKRLE